MRLTHLAEERPQTLLALMQSGQLREELESVVEKANAVQYRMQQANTDPQDMREMVANQIVCPPEEIGLEEPPLTESQRKGVALWADKVAESYQRAIATT